MSMFHSAVEFLESRRPSGTILYSYESNKPETKRYTINDPIFVKKNNTNIFNDIYWYLYHRFNGQPTHGHHVWVIDATT